MTSSKMLRVTYCVPWGEKTPNRFGAHTIVGYISCSALLDSKTFYSSIKNANFDLLLFFFLHERSATARVRTIRTIIFNIYSNV